MESKNIIEIPSFLSFYSLGRLSVLSLKPILLLLSVSFSSDQDAKILALIFTLTASCMLLSNLEIHVSYYKFLFNKNTNHFRLGSEFSIYLRTLLNLGFYVSLLSFCIFLFFVDNFLLAIMFTLALFIEIMISEISRYFIFKSFLDFWTKVFFSRSLFQFLFCLAAYLFYGSYIAEAFLLSSIISGLIIIFKAINLRQINSFYFINISKVKTLSLKGTYTIYKERLYWLLASVFSKHVIMIDRYIVLFLQEKYFAFYILVCTCLSLAPTIFDIFFLSKNRSRYPKELIPKKEITKDKFFRSSLFLGALLSVFSIGFVTYLSLNEDTRINFIVFLPLILAYIVYTYSMPFYELMFWHHSHVKRLWIEFLLLILLVMAGVASSLSSDFFLIFFTLIFLLFLLRHKMITSSLYEDTSV